MCVCVRVCVSHACVGMEPFYFVLMLVLLRLVFVAPEERSVGGRRCGGDGALYFYY